MPANESSTSNEILRLLSASHPITRQQFKALKRLLRTPIPQEDAMRRIASNLLPDPRILGEEAKAIPNLKLLVKQLFQFPKNTITSYREMLSSAIHIATLMLLFYVDILDLHDQKSAFIQIWILRWLSSSITDMLGIENKADENHYRLAVEVMVIQLLYQSVNDKAFRTYYDCIALVAYNDYSKTITFDDKEIDEKFKVLSIFSGLCRILLMLAQATRFPRDSEEDCTYYDILSSKIAKIENNYPKYIEQVRLYNFQKYLTTPQRNTIAAIKIGLIAITFWFAIQQKWFNSILALGALILFDHSIKYCFSYRPAFSLEQIQQMIGSALNSVTIDIETRKATENNAGGQANANNQGNLFIQVGPLTMPDLVKVSKAKIKTRPPKVTKTHTSELRSKPQVEKFQPMLNGRPVYIATNAQIVGRDDSAAFAAAYQALVEGRSFKCHPYKVGGNRYKNLFKIKTGNASTNEQRWIAALVAGCYVICGYSDNSHKRADLSPTMVEQLHTCASDVVRQHSDAGTAPSGFHSSGMRSSA